MAKGPGPLERAADGDDDALEHVLGSVVGPTFDVALHWHASPEAAEGATIAALTDLARAIRSPRVPEDLLTLAVAAVVARPPAGGDLAPAAALVGVEDRDRALVLAALAGGLAPRELAAALRDPEAGERLEAVISSIGDRASLQDELDEAGAAHPLPEGMIETAVKAAGE